MPLLSSEIALRTTIESDVEDIFKIRKHPLVAKSQYPFQPDDTPERYIEFLNSTDADAPCIFRSTTILANDTIVGHVSQHEFKQEFGIVYQVGFNIHPDFWGQGIMTTTLPLVIDRLFEDYHAWLVACNCFHSNHRCQRLLERTGFRQKKISVFEQVQAIYTTRCFRWLKRYMMTRNNWLELESKNTQP